MYSVIKWWWWWWQYDDNDDDNNEDDYEQVTTIKYQNKETKVKSNDFQ